MQIEVGHVELLEHDLRNLLAVDLGVQRTLRLQHRVLVRRHAQLVVEAVRPDLLHVVLSLPPYPVLNYAVLHRVADVQHRLLRLALLAFLSLLTHKHVLLVPAHHHLRVDRPSHLVYEIRPRKVVPAYPRLAKPAPVVNHNRRLIVHRHLFFYFNNSIYMQLII